MVWYSAGRWMQTIWSDIMTRRCCRSATHRTLNFWRMSGGHRTHFLRTRKVLQCGQTTWSGIWQSAPHTCSLPCLRRHWERVSNTLKASTWNSWVWTKLWEALIIDHTIGSFNISRGFHCMWVLREEAWSSDRFPTSSKKKKKSPPDNPMWVKHMVKHMVRHLTGSVTHEGRQGCMDRVSQWKLCVAIFQ